MYIRIGCLCVWCVCSPGLARGSGHRQMRKSPQFVSLCVPEPAPCCGQVRRWKERLRGAKLQGRGLGFSCLWCCWTWKSAGQTFPGGERGLLKHFHCSIPSCASPGVLNTCKDFIPAPMCLLGRVSLGGCSWMPLGQV